MFLFTEAALVTMGGISPAQMTSIIFGALASANAAFTNSGIDLTFNLAFVGLVSFQLFVGDSRQRVLYICPTELLSAIAFPGTLSFHCGRVDGMFLGAANMCCIFYFALFQVLFQRVLPV